MMPGSEAASMMMQPGMTQVQIEQILVRYGYGRWVDYEGQYTVSNYPPSDIGRYNVLVQATGEDGTTDSFETYFDVNAPLDEDFLAPQITELELDSVPAEDAVLPFHIVVMDEGGIRNVEAILTTPRWEQDENNDLYQYTETITMNADLQMSDELNHTYYYQATSRALVNGQDGSSDFQLSIEVEDSYENVAFAAVAFDTVTGLVTDKIWNLNEGITHTAGFYGYPDVGDSVSLTATVESASTPTLSIIMPDLVTTDAVTPTVNGQWYNNTYTTPQNGMLTFRVEVGEIFGQVTFPVNSEESQPAAVNDDDSNYPLLSNLVVMEVNMDTGVEIPNAVYPFQLSGLQLSINATALDSDDERCSNITATITTPAGGDQVRYLKHPRLVVRRTTAEQFVIYMKTMLVFDFGTSYMYQRPTWEVLLERVPSTALLFGSALVLSYVVGISVGVVVAWRRGTALEMGTIIVTLFFYSMPIFWFALIMQWIFYSQLGWFPLGGMGGINPNGDPLHGVAWFMDVMWHLTMPLITLMILGLAGNILLMRSAMLEVIGEDFTTTAKAKGLKERTVVYKHVARNAMLPVVTSMAMSIGGIISGGVLTETIFSWFGMGTLLIEATLTKDFPVVQGAFYVLALITILGNMAADLLYAWLDPRVQL